MKRSALLALVACLCGAFTVGAVGSAATKKSSSKKTSRQTQTTQTQPSGPPPTLKQETAKRDAARDANLEKIADALSVSLDDLKGALKGVRHDELAADVTANRLTQAQADAIEACDAAPLTCDRSNLPAGPPRGGKPGGKRKDDRDAFYAAVAKKLGKSAAEVEKAFEANKPPRPHGGRGPGHGPGGHGGPGRHGGRGPGGPPPAMQGGGEYPGGSGTP